MATSSDVKVRLSAEGVADLVDAFKRIASESKKTGKQVDDDASKMSAAYGKFQKLVGMLGIGKLITSFVGMAKESLELADNLGKLNQKTGITVETLSTLSFAARTADVEQEQLAGSLIKFTRAMDDYDQGAKGVRDATKNLFGDSRALAGLDQDQRLMKIVEALAKLEPGARRTGVAMQFFGKSGAELLPLIDDLGGEGFAKAADEARRLGLEIDENLARAAQQANDAMEGLKSQVKGAVTTIMSEFAPAMMEVATAITDNIGGVGMQGFKKLGEYAGNVAKGIATAFIFAAEAIGELFYVVFSTSKNVTDLVDDWLHGRFKGSVDRFKGEWQATFATIAISAEKTWKTIDDIWTPNAPKPVEVERTGGHSEDLAEKAERERLEKEAERRAERQRKANLELANARIDANAKVADAISKAQEAEDKALYSQGLISLREYYSARTAEAKRQGEIEAKALLDKLEEQQTTPLGKDELPEERQAKILKLAGELQAKIISNAQTLRDISAEQLKEESDLQQQTYDYERRISEAQMTRFELARRAIDEESSKLDDLLRKQGVSAEQRAQRVEDYRTSGYQPIDFDEQSAVAAAAMAELNRQVRQIEQAVRNGHASAAEGEQRILSLEQQRLPLLQQMADAMREAAITPEQIQAAQDFADRLTEMSVNVDHVALEMRNFKESIASAITSDLASWFTQGIQAAESFGDAMRSLALSVVQSIQQIIAQMMAMMLVKKMLGAFGGGTGGADAGAAGFASGGLIRGPGTGTSDSIPARLSNYEYVVRASVVKQPGVLEMLNTLNYGTPRIKSIPRFSRFADGGLVDTSATAAGGNANLTATLGLDEGLLLRRLEASPAFSRVLVRLAGDNRKAMRQAIG